MINNKKKSYNIITLKAFIDNNATIKEELSF